MLLSEKPNVIFFRPKKMGGGRGVCLRQRQKIFILPGASWRVCWALHRTYRV